MKLLFLVAIGLCIYIFKNRRFSNPYKLVMLIGKKGSGKTTFLVKTGLKEVKKGKTVYTNIDGCSVPEFRYINSSDLGEFVPPPDSVLLLDEAGMVYDNRKFKGFSDATRDFFKLQRHYRVTVYLASQSLDVDKKLRDLVDHLILVQSFLPGISLLRPIKRSITLVEASSMGESRIADNLKFRSILSWRFLGLKKFSKFFDSFQVPFRPLLPYNEIGES